MSDNDLIRRGEVRELLQQCGLMGNHPSDPLAVMFNEIPAVQPTVKPDVAPLVEAAEVLLMQHDFENPMRQADYHGDICQCRRCRMDGLRAALASVKGVM